MSGSVIIPTYNKKERLYLTLLAICGQTCPRDQFEVIVVDDGSTDGTKEMIDKLEVDYELRYYEKKNEGRAAARNYGAIKAKYPLLLFVDDDCLLSRNYIEENCKQNDGNFVGHNTILDLPFLKFIKDPVTGGYYDEYKKNGSTSKVLAGVLLKPESVKKGNFDSLKSRMSTYERNVNDIFEEIKDVYINQISWLTCTGAGISIQKRIFQELGGFDEGFGVEWGSEDLEFGLRLYLKGYCFRRLEETKLYHMTHYRKNPELLIQKAMDYTYSKHKMPIIGLVKEYYFIQNYKVSELRNVLENNAGMLWLDEKFDSNSEKETIEFPSWPQFSEETIGKVQEPLRTGKVSYWTGKYGTEFEQYFEQYCDVKYAYTVNSATSGLLLALLACNIGPGDEVIVPSYTFLATATSVLMANAIPVFADIDPQTFTLSVSSIREAITERTKAIIPVHLNGNVAEMDEINQLAKEHNLVVIEDASQALGAQYKGKYVGTLGDIGVFSFCQDKTITTGGEGGMVTTNHAEFAKKINSMRSHGFRLLGKRSFMESQKIFPYIFENVGYNFRMTEIQSVIGLTEIKRLESWNLANRRRNAGILRRYLENVPEIRLQTVKEYVSHGYYKFPIVLKKECFTISRAEFIQALEKEGLVVEPGDTPDNYKQGVFAHNKNSNGICPFSCPYNHVYKYSELYLPVSEEVGKQVIRVRVHPTLTARDMEKTAFILKKVIEQYKVTAEGGND